MAGSRWRANTHTGPFWFTSLRGIRSILWLMSKMKRPLEWILPNSSQREEMIWGKSFVIWNLTRDFFAPKQGNLEHTSLIIWVNALSFLAHPNIINTSSINTSTESLRSFLITPEVSLSESLSTKAARFKNSIRFPVTVAIEIFPRITWCARRPTRWSYQDHRNMWNH